MDSNEKQDDAGPAEETAGNGWNSAGGPVDPDWEYWKCRAVFMRVFGRLYKEIAAEVGIHEERVGLWLRQPEARKVIREIRREQLSILYGGALELAETARDSLTEILNNRMGVIVDDGNGGKRIEVEVPATVRVQAISLVYKICGDAATAIQGEELTAILKLAEETKALGLQRSA